MKDIIVWAIHTPTGTLALVTAVVAMFARKGRARHRKAGSWFTVSMMVMLVSGIAAAYLKDSIIDMMLGAFVMYTVFTAWLAVHHKKNEAGLLEVIALIWVVGFAITAFSISLSWRGVESPLAYLIWGGLAILCAFGDIRNLYLSGLSGTQRIIRHVWRIGFSLVWAALAFTDKIVKMLGANLKTMQEEQLLLIVAIPTMAILITILYWIAKILFFSHKRFAGYG
ncbi:hypothetical protein DIT71_03220 [Marinobacter vulgaris]|uniref:DUF2306 domain-containing protein n=1 Tax=Marinobacter vulgaris TaxID=1928331 RepID=A0A2V3ZR44_9GAMM|nr:hypothetical protein [Marinobacter vulgaris]PXX93822.1 hypothetical protein DIT71_03220 [Marinobacter vulgaris]TSJ72158.1 hypothetical protein FPC41_00050 [Marinobacter vulgaris]